MSYIFFTLIGIIPSFAWLIFFLKEDVHPEPKKMIAKVFAYGALITIVAVSIQYLSRTAFLFLKIDNFSFFPIFLFAATE
ncbi:hypothetical protein HY227_02410 [Candidatus Wolfebacteria bacterium]|nr:hypothetical protein [Candidatus Wolfebacteria bacterium]